MNTSQDQLWPAAGMFVFKGVPLSELISTRRRALSDMVLVGLTEEVLSYRHIPLEALNVDIMMAIELGMGLFLDTLERGEMPSDEEWTALSESAARRAEEGIELASVLAAYHVGTRLLMEELVQYCGPSDGPQAVAACALAVRFLTKASEVVADSYMQERVAIVDVDADVLADRLRRLFEGDPAEEDVAPAHVVVQFNVGPHPDENDEPLGSEIAARRKTRRVRARISQEGDEVLGTVSQTGGMLLVVVRDGDVQAATARVPAMMARIEAAAQAPVHAAMVVATAVGRLGNVAKVATELLDLVLQLGREPGVYRIEDVAVEYQMTRPGPARALLAESVAPLAERPDLYETLRVFLRTGQDRRATAQRMHVHPNTVDYRLQRAAEVLAADPTDARNAVTLAGAMLAFGAEQRDA